MNESDNPLVEPIKYQVPNTLTYLQIYPLRNSQVIKSNEYLEILDIAERELLEQSTRVPEHLDTPLRRPFVYSHGDLRVDVRAEQKARTIPAMKYMDAKATLRGMHDKSAELRFRECTVQVFRSDGSGRIRALLGFGILRKGGVREKEVGVELGAANEIFNATGLIYRL
ncbi:MAG: hypothetical protein LQ351_006077 [Letrouitia transgressa]|nr:MAG: hypothetical protein LQ351_006077 [Letrouitia transgressa]